MNVTIDECGWMVASSEAKVGLSLIFRSYKEARQHADSLERDEGKFYSVHRIFREGGAGDLHVATHHVVPHREVEYASDDGVLFKARNKSGRRRKAFSIPYDYLLDLVSGKLIGPEWVALPRAKNVPRTARVIGIQLSGPRFSLEIIYEDESFPEIENGVHGDAEPLEMECVRVRRADP